MARRSGGRQARHAQRSAPLSEELKPVRPGERGGQYQPFAKSDLDAVVANIFRILEEVGFKDATPHCIEACQAVGAILGEDGRLRMPRAVVDDALGKARRNLTLFAQDPAFDLDLSGTRVHFSTAGAAVMVADSVRNEYRESTSRDLYDLARIVDNCENIHMFQRMCVLRDIEDNYEMDLNTTYCSVAGTRKHVGASWGHYTHLEKTLEMLHVIAGGEAQWRERPFVSQSNCFVVPPMKFATDALECLRVAVEGGMPVLLLSAGQAGATTPACLAGAVSQAWAECLGGLVYVNAIKPGAPAIIGTWPFVSDLRTGAMSGGSGEQALLSAGCAQMHRYYDLPGGAAAGIADAKLPDMQAGWEQATSNVMAGLSGLNMVYEAAGMHASLLGFCLESLILGDDLIGQALRCVRGIEVTEDTVSVDVIRATCLEGPGHYLGSDQTLALMQTEYIYPALGDRTSPKEWEELGKPDLLQKATARKSEILSRPSAARFDPAIDSVIRDRFKIHLPA